MNSSGPLVIPLNLGSEQHARLCALQAVFAQACNAISPVAWQQRCWNRVALHHLVYYKTREQFSQLGSQMICNAVYSVCRIYRMVCENPTSPFSFPMQGNGGPPLIKFLDSNPVFFDRHTLSIKAGVLSMFTLNGRMRFQVSLDEPSLHRFENEKLREIILIQDQSGFKLNFAFASNESNVINLQWPNYVVVMSDESEKLIAEDIPNKQLNVRKA